MLWHYSIWWTTAATGSLCYCDSSKCSSPYCFSPLPLILPFLPHWLPWGARTCQARSHIRSLASPLCLGGSLSSPNFGSRGIFSGRSCQTTQLKTATPALSFTTQPYSMVSPCLTSIRSTFCFLICVCYIFYWLICSVFSQCSHEDMDFFLIWSLLYPQHHNTACRVV